MFCFNNFERKKHISQKIFPLRGPFIHEFHWGAMRQKMAIFKRGNSVWRGTKIFNGGDVDENRHFIEGGDVDENRHFIEGKVVAHYQKLNILNGGDVMKIVILLRESWSHITKN